MVVGVWSAPQSSSLCAGDTKRTFCIGLVGRQSFLQRLSFRSQILVRFKTTPARAAPEPLSDAGTAVLLWHSLHPLPPNLAGGALVRNDSVGQLADSKTLKHLFKSFSSMVDSLAISFLFSRSGLLPPDGLRCARFGWL